MLQGVNACGEFVPLVLVTPRHFLLAVVLPAELSQLEESLAAARPRQVLRHIVRLGQNGERWVVFNEHLNDRVHFLVSFVFFDGRMSFLAWLVRVCGLGLWFLGWQQRRRNI